MGKSEARDTSTPTFWRWSNLSQGDMIDRLATVVASAGDLESAVASIIREVATAEREVCARIAEAHGQHQIAREIRQRGG